MKAKENKEIWELYLESPWRYHSPSFIENLDLSVDDVLKNGEKIDTFQTLNVFTFKRNPKSYVFLKGDEIVAYYEWIDSKIGGAIKNKLIWNTPNFKGYFRKIFGDYIIPKFKNVESDNMLTDKAFTFWKKMIEEYPQYNYYVIDEGEWIEIKNPKIIDQYKGGVGDESTFFVSQRNS